MVPRAGFEHATTRSSAERSPRLSYLGTFDVLFSRPRDMESLIIYAFSEILSYLLRQPIQNLTPVRL
jgi:hypothetical protein